MKADDIVNDDMTLEEKLNAIDAALKVYQADNKKKYPGDKAPVDPADALMCEGCQ